MVKTKLGEQLPETPIADAVLKSNKTPKTKKVKVQVVNEQFYDCFEQTSEERFFPMTETEVSEMVIEKLNETITPDPIVEDSKEEMEVFDVEVSPITEDVMEEAQDENISDEVKKFLSYEIDELYEFIRLANERLVFLQSNEISEIEAEISRLKERLAVLKGQTDTIKDEIGFPMKEKKKKAFDPIVNPENPDEVYTAGRLPEWVIKLSETTGKTIRQLRGIDD